MRYLKSIKGYKHSARPNVVLKFVDSAIPCNLNGIGVDFYADDDRTVLLLKVINNDGVYNKQKIPSSAERFFESLEELNDFIDRDVYNDAASLQRLISKLM